MCWPISSPTRPTTAARSCWSRGPWANDFLRPSPAGCGSGRGVRPKRNSSVADRVLSRGAFRSGLPLNPHIRRGVVRGGSVGLIAGLCLAALYLVLGLRRGELTEPIGYSLLVVG